MQIDRLGAALKQTIRLTFRDGEVVEALLLGVDTERNHDLTYEVPRVVRTGAQGAKPTQVGTTYIASLNHLQSWEPLQEKTDPGTTESQIGRRPAASASLDRGKEMAATEPIGCLDQTGYSRGGLRPPLDLRTCIRTSDRDRM